MSSLRSPNFCHPVFDKISNDKDDDGKGVGARLGRPLVRWRHFAGHPPWFLPLSLPSLPAPLPTARYNPLPATALPGLTWPPHTRSPYQYWQEKHTLNQCSYFELRPLRSLAAGVLDPGAGLVRVDTMYKGFNAFVENLLIIRYVSSGPCQNCHMNWTKRPRQWKRPILYESQPSKEFNCDITDQSRHSQAGPGWKVNTRFRGQMKGWKWSQLSQTTNQTENSQQSQMNELHILSSVITFLKKKNCFAILATYTYVI